MLDTVNAATKAADHAAMQTPTWWVAIMGIVLLVAAAFMIRWFINTYESLAKGHETMMQQIIQQQQKTISELAAVLTKNTEALARNTQALDGCRDALQVQTTRQMDCARIQDEFRRIVPRLATMCPGSQQ